MSFLLLILFFAIAYVAGYVMYRWLHRDDEA